MAATAWSPTTKRLIIVGLVIVLLLVLYVFRALLPPIAIALVLAYILKPLADLVERRTKMPRTLSVIIVFIVLLLIVSLIPATVLPYAVDRFTRLNLDFQKLTDDLLTFLSQPISVLGYSISLQDMVGDLQGALQDLLRPFATQTVTVLFGVASSLLWLLSILVISFYLVKDAGRLRSFLDRLAPPGHIEELRRLREEINHVWKAFFRGQLLLGIIIGVVVWLAMIAVGLPNAGLMGLLAGLLEVIPTFGPVLATIPALLVAFFLGSTYLPLSNFWFAVLVLGVYTLIQQLENAYLVPRIMGRRLQLHPVVVFIGVLAGGLLFGALGVLLAAPIIGTLRVALSYTYAKLLDEDPYPPEFVEAGEIYPGEIDAILFDLDGTLIETDDQAVEALTRRLQPLRRFLPGRDPAKAARRILISCEGPANSILTFLDRIGLDDDVLDLGDRLRQMRGLSTPLNFRPQDGVVEMLQDLSQRYHLAIVTTRSRLHAELFVSQQKLADVIQVIVGREDTWRIKPHPSPVQHAAELLNVPVERCLMVGDTTADIWAARSAGARSAGVVCGFGDQDELERAGADIILQTTGALQELM
ncbi:MAG: AI-2E family transporter [Anaerolineae bacterium]|jgi:HAD superfamily hydrolase (TIGR01549 family)